MSEWGDVHCSSPKCIGGASDFPDNKELSAFQPGIDAAEGKGQGWRDRQT